MRAAVVIPAYNSASTLAETLAALSEQDGLADYCLGVYVIDDASTDETASLAEAVWAGAVPLTVHRRLVNGGERCTVNEALDRLQGSTDWVLLLHADDLPKPHWLATMCSAAICAAPTTATVCSSWDNFNGLGWEEPGEDLPGAPIVHVAGTVESVRSTLHRGCWWHVSGCAIRLSSFERIGPFEPEMPQLGDLDWLLRCLASGHSVDYIPRTLLRYRAHAGSVTSASHRVHRDIVEWRSILTVHGSVLAPREIQRLYRRQVTTLLRRLARSIVEQDRHRAMAAISLTVTLAGDMARHFMPSDTKHIFLE